jgi:hypothetical protein
MSGTGARGWRGTLCWRSILQTEWTSQTIAPKPYTATTVEGIDFWALMRLQTDTPQAEGIGAMKLKAREERTFTSVSGAGKAAPAAEAGLVDPGQRAAER